MKICHIVLRCGTSLDEVKVGSLVHDDQRVLKLPGARRIQTEIGLKRNLHGDARRDIDEGTAGPDRAMQRRELMVRRRNQLHEVILYHLCVGAVHGALEICIDHALFRDLLLHIVIDELGIILRADTGQRLSLRLRNTELLKGVLDFLRNFRPLRIHLCVRAHVGHNIFHVEALNRRAPVRHLPLVEYPQGLHTEIMHPLRIILSAGDLLDNLLRQPLLDAIGILILISEVV